MELCSKELMQKEKEIAILWRKGIKLDRQLQNIISQIYKIDSYKASEFINLLNEEKNNG